MNRNEKTSADRSAKSRVVSLEERRLRVTVKKIEEAIAKAEEQIVKLESEKAELTKKLFHHGGKQGPLDRAVLELAKARGLIEAYKKERGDTQAAIEKLAPTDAQIQARIAEQWRFTELATERFVCANNIDRLLKELRAALSEQDKLAADIGKSAYLLGLALPALDTEKFDALLASLPEETSSTVDCWCAKVIGRSETEPYIVIDEYLEIPETLFDHGLYSFGEAIQLTGEQARELTRKDRARKVGGLALECRPPSVLSEADWELANSEAKARGISLWEVLAVRAQELEEEGRKKWKAKQDELHKVLDTSMRHELPRLPEMQPFRG